MRALTLQEPWAQLVAGGHKAVETRSWTTDYRGPLLIHAAKGFPDVARWTCLREPFRSCLGVQDADVPGIKVGRPRVDLLPLGAVVAVAQLRTVERITPSLLRALQAGPVAQRHELEFGDYTFGRFAWLLGEVTPLETPIYCSGALGLWTPPAWLLDDVGAALTRSVA